MGKRKNMEREKMKGKRSYEIQGRKRGDKMKKKRKYVQETGNRKKEKDKSTKRQATERKGGK